MALFWGAVTASGIMVGALALGGLADRYGAGRVVAGRLDGVAGVVDTLAGLVVDPLEVLNLSGHWWWPTFQ